jgi:hypothetical protein
MILDDRRRNERRNPGLRVGGADHFACRHFQLRGRDQLVTGIHARRTSANQLRRAETGQNDEFKCVGVGGTLNHVALSRVRNPFASVFECGKGRSAATGLTGLTTSAGLPGPTAGPSIAVAASAAGAAGTTAPGCANAAVTRWRRSRRSRNSV